MIQRKARELGIGEPTGIDLPSEFPGVLPDKRWREQENKLELACERRRHVSNCGIVLEPTGTWTVGDNMHLAVGQGELLTDPLQMAVAYSTLANAYIERQRRRHGRHPAPRHGDRRSRRRRAPEPVLPGAHATCT